MRNRSLDAVRAIAALFVVWIHVSFPGETGRVVKALARFAVPLFFMVSGYFCYYDNEKILRKISHKLSHTIRLTIYSLIFYFIWKAILTVYRGESLELWLRGFCTPIYFKELLLYNYPVFISVHLWFLCALLYCYCAQYLLEKFHAGKGMYIIGIILLAMFFWRQGICKTAGISYACRQYRNFWFMGMPLFLLGRFIHEYREIIEIRFSKRILRMGVAAGILCTIIEYGFWGAKELYPGSILLAFCLFAGAILYDNSKVPGWLAETGAKYGGMIYILHIAVRDIQTLAADRMGISKNILYLWTRPLAVYIMTLLLAVFLEWCSNRAKNVCQPVHYRKNML